MLTPRRLLAAPAAALLALALAACGGSAPEAAPSASPSASPSPSPEPEGLDLTAENFVATLTEALTAAGSYDFTMSMSADGESLVANGSVQTQDGAQAIAMVMDMPEIGQMEVRLTGGMAYVGLGEITGGKFLQIDPADTSHPLADAFTGMVDEIDPTQGLTGEAQAIVSVTPVGEPEQLDGVEVQAYDLVVDPSKSPEMFAELQSSLPEGVEAPATITYRYWIDADALVRKASFDVLETSGEMTFSNWGNGTPVTAPTADQISTEDPFAG